jgi:hypothetical protein
MTHLLNQSFTCIYLSIRLACGWSRRCGTAEGVDGDGEEKGFCEPEGVVAEAGGGPGAEDGSGEEAEADEAEGAGLGEALFTGLGSGAGGESVVEAFGYIAKVAGDEGGVVGEAVDPAEAGDLEGSNVAMMPVNSISGKLPGSQPRAKMTTISNPRPRRAERRPRRVRKCLEVRTPAKKPARGTMWGMISLQSRPRMAMPRKMALPEHGVGEDVAVVEVDDSVEQAAGGGEEHGVRERFGLDGVAGQRHGDVDWWTSQRVS